MRFSLKTSFCFILLLLLFQSIGLAQDSLDSKHYTYSLGGYLSKGFIIMHDKEMGHLAQSHPEGFSLTLEKHTYGKRDWEKILNYPDIGFSFHYFNYHNPTLGKTFSALSYLDFYLIRNRTNSFNFQFGWGFCYTTNPYDPETNNKNIAMGSSITYALHAQLAYNQQIFDRLNLIAGLRLSHYSNGAFKKPNKGINVPTLDLGLSYLLNRQRPEYLTFSKKPEIDERITYNLFLASGLKENDPVGSKKYPFLTFSIYASKQVSLSNSFNIGFDGFYSIATREERETDRELNGSKPDFKRVGFTGGHELLIGKLSLLTQLGVYIYRPYKTDKPVYQRYGLKYAFSDRLFGGMFLKCHYGKAEAVEWGVGIKL